MWTEDLCKKGEGKRMKRVQPLDDYADVEGDVERTAEMYVPFFAPLIPIFYKTEIRIPPIFFFNVNCAFPNNGKIFDFPLGK